MIFTNEYTVLFSQDGGEDVIIKPGKINAFSYIEGKYKPSAYARLLNLDTLKEVAILEVGQVYNGIGEKPIPKKKAVK